MLELRISSVPRVLSELQQCCRVRRLEEFVNKSKILTTFNVGVLSGASSSSTEEKPGLQPSSYDAEYRNLDIADGRSIDRFVTSFTEDFGQLDILVNNAAISFKTSDSTPYKEQAFATINPNFFGTVRLTELLLPVLHKSDAPRIVNVASQMGHLRILTSNQLKSRFLSATTVSEVDTLMKEFVSSVEDGTHAENGWASSIYSVSKVGLIAYTRVIARREAELHPTKNILINAVCPGYCDTDLTSHMGPRSAEMGARTPASLALLGAGGPNGKFMYDDAEIEW